jgi:hypothetical protein
MRIFGLTLTAILAAVVAVNAAASWQQARRNAALVEAAGALEPGFAVADYRDVDERGFQRARLQALPTPRVVAFGSSRIMQLTTAALGLRPGDFYNAGMAGAVVEDFAALWSVLKRQRKVPGVAVIAIDPWTFNAGRSDVRWLALVDEIEGAGPLALLKRGAYEWYRLTELASYPVLRKTIGDARRAFRENGGPRPPSPVVPEAALAGRQALRWDGSLEYEGWYLARSATARRQAADLYAAKLTGLLPSFRWDDSRVTRLVDLWRDLRHHDIKVVAFIAPYHPRAWSALEGELDRAPRMAAGVASLRATAERLGVVFADLADPARIPCREDEFLDGDHASAACLGRALVSLGATHPR